MADPSETTQVSRESAQRDVEDRDELLGTVRSLAVQVGGLQAELHAHRHDVQGLPASDG